MGQFFKNDLHDEFGTWPLAYTASGGPDAGLILAVAKEVGDGDDTAFYNAWVGAGDKLAAEAGARLAGGHRDSACRLYLQAAVCYATSSHPFFGSPVDPRLAKAFRSQIAASNSGLALRPVPVKPLRIPFEGTTLPAYFIPAKGRENERRPLVIITDGYDSSVTELYFFAAAAIAERGYHCLYFDGPGQGEMLIEQGLPMRAEWETVIRPVVDFALTLPNIDASKIALMGLSLGGYLALRGASGEPRLAACIADPGLGAVMTTAMLVRFGLSADQAANPASMPPEFWQKAINSNPDIHWKIVQRGFWVHGVNTMPDYIAATMAMTLDGRYDKIKCPTLLTTAENDPLSHGAEEVLGRLSCPKTLLSFTAAEGAGEHCEMRNRALANVRMIDWLDETLTPL